MFLWYTENRYKMYTTGTVNKNMANLIFLNLWELSSCHSVQRTYCKQTDLNFSLQKNWVSSDNCGGDWLQLLITFHVSVSSIPSVSSTLCCFCSSWLQGQFLHLQAPDTTQCLLTYTSLSIVNQRCCLKNLKTRLGPGGSSRCQDVLCMEASGSL